MTEAALLITLTSSGCARYELLRDGRRIWINRVAPTEAGHAGARSRMAAWAIRYNVSIVGMEPDPVKVAQAVIPGRYGRH